MPSSATDRLSAELSSRADSLGIRIPSLLVPAQGIDLYRWAVVACDQYTAQPEYWKETERIVGDAPSTLHLVLPEIYLEQPGELPVAGRIARINQTMAEYLQNGVLTELPPGCMLVDRATPFHPSRKGLLLAIDLERYDFQPGNRQLTRATEGTVLERIPPRQAIRRDALLELPHVQLLIDDPHQTVIEPLAAAFATADPLYATPLMQGGGFVRGWPVPADRPELLCALTALSQLESLRQYGLLFAVGDGNHSLATAKAHWESIRATVGPDHPARYALAEVINIHDPGLAFEPIHRVVFNLDAEALLEHARLYFARAAAAHTAGAEQTAVVPVLSGGHQTSLEIRCDASELLAGTVQAMLDDLIARRPHVRLDYIHGEEVVRELTGQGAVGLLLPALDKATFFSRIARDGILPRKTFSMGEACEKRYYFESRRIR
jgi:hypothetical protein